MQDPSRPATGYPAFSYNHPNGYQAPPSGTAYPYAAPPPYSQPQYHNPNPERNYFTRSFVRAFLATITCLFVIFGTIIFIIWLVFRPTLPHVRVESLSVTNFSANAKSVTGTWQVGFLVHNSNKKMTVTYHALRSSIFYKSVYLSEAQLAPFKQETKSQTTLNATFSAVNAYVDGRVVDDMNRDKASGSIDFDVQILSSTSFRSGAWRLRMRELKVLCRKVPVGISSNSTSGRLSGYVSECQVWT